VSIVSVNFIWKFTAYFKAKNSFRPEFEQMNLHSLLKLF